ncbi:MAG: carbohydrate kinase [Clostridia bacterium]|nr:carbohydrate kinase [Clostridia bacterium]
MANDTLVAIGEALIDFIPDKSGCPFYEVTGFSPAVGGAPANVCAAFTRLGGKSRMITQLGNDPFGDKITRTLKDAGIDTSCVQYTDKANTALAFVSLAEDGNRTFSFYRKPSADMLLGGDDVKPEWFKDAYAMHFCSVSIGDFPMRDAHIKAIEYAKEAGALISFDPNLRFPLWDSKEDLKAAVDRFLPYADVLKISDEELEFITGETDIEKALSGLFKCGARLIVYTCGSDGAYAFTENSKSFSPSLRVKAVDTTGAGDGFIGSFLWKLHEKKVNTDNISDISGEDLKDCLDFSNKFCAVSVTKKGAIDSYPTLNEI